MAARRQSSYFKTRCKVHRARCRGWQGFISGGAPWNAVRSPCILDVWCALHCAQGVLNWVAEPEPRRAPPSLEARLYGPLFRSQTPGDLGDEWIADLNPESLTTVAGALAGPALVGAKAGDWHAPPPPPLPFCMPHVCFCLAFERCQACWSLLGGNIKL